MHHLSLDIDGNIILIWTWSAAENETRTEIIEGTFMQKVNPVTGKILLNPAGGIILNKDILFALDGGKNNIFLFKLPSNKFEEQELVNVDKNGKMLWSLKCFENLRYWNNVNAYVTATGDLFMLYVSKDVNIRGSYISANGNILFQDKIFFPDTYKLSTNSPLIQWGDNGYVFIIKDSLYYFNYEGEQLWGDSGILLHPIESIIFSDIKVLSDETLLVLYSTLMDSTTNNRVLRMQKISREGKFQWNCNGIELIKNVGGSSWILPDTEGGAFIVTDAHLMDEPDFQPRGTYIMHIDQKGHFTTKVEEHNLVINEIPEKYSIVKTNPNPFRDQIKFTIQKNSYLNFFPASFVIYNILGEEVLRYDLSQQNNVNVIELIWYGENRYDQKVCPGIYFYQVLSNDLKNLTSGKLILTR